MGPGVIQPRSNKRLGRDRRPAWPPSGRACRVRRVRRSLGAVRPGADHRRPDSRPCRPRGWRGADAAGHARDAGRERSQRVQPESARWRMGCYRRDRPSRWSGDRRTAGPSRGIAGRVLAGRPGHRHRARSRRPVSPAQRGREPGSRRGLDGCGAASGHADLHSDSDHPRLRLDQVGDTSRIGRGGHLRRLRPRRTPWAWGGPAHLVCSSLPPDSSASRPASTAATTSCCCPPSPCGARD